MYFSKINNFFVCAYENTIIYLSIYIYAQVLKNIYTCIYIYVCIYIYTNVFLLLHIIFNHIVSLVTVVNRPFLSFSKRALSSQPVSPCAGERNRSS